MLNPCWNYFANKSQSSYRTAIATTVADHETEPRSAAHRCDSQTHDQLHTRCLSPVLNWPSDVTLEQWTKTVYKINRTQKKNPQFIEHKPTTTKKKQPSCPTPERLAAAAAKLLAAHHVNWTRRTQEGRRGPPRTVRRKPRAESRDRQAARTLTVAARKVRAGAVRSPGDWQNGGSLAAPSKAGRQTTNADQGVPSSNVKTDADQGAKKKKSWQDEHKLADKKNNVKE